MFQALFIVCARVIRCQTINHMVHGEICELNNRTKEAKPEYFTDDPTKVYMKKFRKKFLVGYFTKAVPFFPAGPLFLKKCDVALVWKEAIKQGIFERFDKTSTRPSSKLNVL